MKAQNPFSDPRLLLADGRDELHGLNVAVGKFIAQTAHFHVPRFDLDKHVYVHTVQFEEDPPPRFAVSVRKIVSPLRSALDHAVHASAASLGNANRKTAFPFGDTSDQFEQDVRWKCRGVAPEIISTIRAFRPYREGNEDLWALNKLRNIKEHRLLVAPALGGGMRWPFEIAGKKIFMLHTSPEEEPQWDDVNKTLTFTTLAQIEHLPPFEKIEKKLVFFLRFGDIQGVAGEHLIPKLEAFAHIVENCIDSIEEKTGLLLQNRQKSAARLI
jgi:hypothetical protein